MKIEQTVVPIEIGTSVYFVDWKNEIRHGVVSMLQQKSDKSWKFRVSEGGFVFDRAEGEIGKTVFLTFEDAANHVC